MVCERCKPNFVPSKDNLQCICPSGTWYSCGSSACECKACDRAMFCPGGNPAAKNHAPDSQKGLRLSCVKAEEVNATNTLITTTSIQRQGLTTKTTRAKRFVDCVTLPGFYLKTTSPATQEAAPCRRNTYSPGYSRLRQCLRCQSGTAENPDAGFADVDALQPGQYPDKASLRTDRLKVCQVPPGGYLSQNVVRDCPPGSFRGSFTYTTETASRYCFSCPAGLTTSKARATLPSDCNIVGAGVLFTQDTIAQAIALATTTPGEAPDNSSTTPCSYGSYFPGGPFVGGITCLPCPLGSTTKGLGATSPNDCMVPPGYFIQLDAAGASTGKMVKCPENADGQGYFRAGWVRFDDENVQEAGSGTTACSSCGKGIKSALTDVDEALGGTDTTALVAGSSVSCYIETGWGMIPTGVVKADYTMEFAATVCDKNTYGVADTTFGLQATPCKPCARNLITLQAGSTDPSQCVNPGGYGYTPTGANRCAVGSYTSLASLGACMPCPEGRTTADDAAKQTSIADCFVQPGHGIVLPDCQPSVNSSADAGATPPIDPTFICEADNEGSHDCSSGHCNCKNKDSCSGGGNKNCTWMPSGPDKKEGTCCKGKPSLGRRLLQLPTDACAAALAALNDTQLAQLPTQLCPMGSYSRGGQLASVCAACNAGTTTQREGSTSKDECNKCKPGYGKQPGSADCTKCITGTYQAGFAGNEDAVAHGNGETCIACPTTLSIFLSSKGKEAEFNSSATTFRSGSTGEEECVPQTVQVSWYYIQPGDRLQTV
ncbi:hypothetical protein OEZ85_012210 [Tetradesmus obliquus]|uniref:Tyrosine-protein kinase ephrin type A/B receptor-like domain-containing protein n=1 Tax=Tetradesmus obliquus TaxID=3088 RepID=A0ABY8TUZ2_TETOB|nr:hypothetical protein OEZ85_012210 [Tetradesmus obliquus]